ISCPHIEKSCTAAYYADRKLGVSEMIATAASVIHLFTGNNIGPRSDLASRSLHVRLNVNRVDPENRKFTHPDPIRCTENHRAEILNAFYTILLGNPQLKAPRNAEAKTRFKMWWRLVGSALEHAAKLSDQELDFQKLFVSQEEEDEDSASLADILKVMRKKWPEEFQATDVAGWINNEDPYRHDDDKQTLRDFLLQSTNSTTLLSAKSIGRLLKKRLDEPARSGDQTLILRREKDLHADVFNYRVDILRE